MEFILLYHRLAQRYLRQFLGHGPSPLHNPLSGQGQVIAALKKRDGISTKELAAMLDIRTASQWRKSGRSASSRRFLVTATAAPP